MIITCEACNTSFNLDDKMLKPTGSKVRCSVCAKVFTAFPPEAPTPAPVEEPVASDPLAEAEADQKTDLASAAAMGSVDAADNLDAVVSTDAHEPETDILEEDTGMLLDEDNDLDFTVEEESKQDLSDVEIEDAVSDILDEDLADTSAATEFEPDLALEPDIPDESDATVIVSLDDDDLDLSLDEFPDMDEPGMVDPGQEDHSMDTPPFTGGDSEGTATVIADLDDDMLDLDDDFSLEPEDAVDSMPSSGEKQIETMDDLDDLDLTLDLDDTDAGDMETAADFPGLEDDLDLSSLENLLKDDDDQDDDDDSFSTLVVDESQEPELTLDMEDDLSAAEADSTVLSEDYIEDLELDLDADGGAETVDIDSVDDDDQEIDLSEIEKMLEEPEPGSGQLSSVPEQDLDLDLEANLETGNWKPGSGDNDMLVKDEEIDLSELEQVLDDVDTDESDQSQEELELDLDLDLGDGEAAGIATEAVATDDELEFTPSDFEDEVLPKDGAEAASRESDEMVLEFDVEETSQDEQTTKDERMKETVALSEPKTEKVENVPPAHVAAAAPMPKPVKKGVSKSLVFLLIIAILGGGGYGAYYLLNQKGMDIPFISDFLKPKVNDPGYLKLTTYDINSKFVENASVGNLFVVSGQVKNGYTENRGMITLVGKLISSGKITINEEKVYCGNVMSDLELANLEWDKIKARLANRLGDNRSNVKIEPGKSIPFMVVFSDLPDDLEEFTIEVTGSTVLK
jgi:predicted Zn finger-like uncharacterized protein